jgi:hypothetical protein
MVAGLGCALVGCCAISAGAASPLVTGTDTGVPAHVKAFSGLPPAETASFFAYPTTFNGGVRVAVGDVTGDKNADIITGAGPGGGPHVKVFDGQTQAEVRSFFAYDPAFTGGVYVAAGDINGDRRADIITGAGTAPHVKVFDAVTSAERASFFAYSPAFTGGVRVAAGDVNGDGLADIVTGSGPGAGHVKVFDAITQAEVRSFFAYGPSYTGGVFVAAGDVTGDGLADLITGTDDGFAPQVKVFDAVTSSEVRSFFAFDPTFTGGVRVGAGDVNGDGIADILTATGLGGTSDGPTLVKVFDGKTGGVLANFMPYSAAYKGGAFVAGETPVPEPGLLPLLATGAGLVAAQRRRRVA